ncbi:MAG TPA: [protein-PII] uridylyltransferase, partial [Acidimicrobiales bacterium]|nr:[protein-PII] uridylyltransferase [Acidimicrobiales bacterium]
PRRLSDASDGFLAELLVAATHGDVGGVCLLGVGSYGRRELCPGSDLDLVLVHKGRRDVDEVAERVWYRIWDEGVRLDHSVRTPRETISAARDDLKVALGLLDARVVAGDEVLGTRVIDEAREQFRAHAGRYLGELATVVDDRRESAGEVPFVLEPDLKEARGGLRDVAALHAFAHGVPGIAPSLRLDDVAQPAATLLTVRAALHARTGKGGDRLLLQEQDQVAEMLGDADADALMSRVAAAGREIAWACDSGLRRVRSHIAGPRGRSGTRDRDLAPGVVLRDGEIAMTSAADPGADASLLTRVAALAAEEAADIEPATLDRLAEAHPPPNGSADKWSPQMLTDFLVVLGCGSRGVTVLEALDRRRLLERLVPEWAAVRSKPQRNAYHRFTVDRHLLEAASEAASLVREVSRPDLLLVGALLHDIGKGFPGDHTDAGIEVVPRIAERMGLTDRDVSTLVQLVRHHLLLADTATRRDLDDPSTIELVAAAVGDRETLHLLAALTEADSLATGPAAWGKWKAQLVRELVARTDEELARTERGTSSRGDGASGPQSP